MELPIELTSTRKLLNGFGSLGEIPRKENLDKFNTFFNNTDLLSSQILGNDIDYQVNKDKFNKNSLIQQIKLTKEVFNHTFSETHDKWSNILQENITNSSSPKSIKAFTKDNDLNYVQVCSHSIGVNNFNIKELIVDNEIEINLNNVILSSMLVWNSDNTNNGNLIMNNDVEIIILCKDVNSSSSSSSSCCNLFGTRVMVPGIRANKNGIGISNSLSIYLSLSLSISI
jgi:hypothetical protein